MVLNFFRSKVAYCDINEEIENKNQEIRKIDEEISRIDSKLENIRFQKKIIDGGLILFAVSSLLYVVKLAR